MSVYLPIILRIKSQIYGSKALGDAAIGLCWNLIPHIYFVCSDQNEILAVHIFMPVHMLFPYPGNSLCTTHTHTTQPFLSTMSQL